MGKSRLALQLAAGVVSGGQRADKSNQANEARIWIETPSDDMLRLGNAVEAEGSPTVYATWEDEPEETWRRLSDLSGCAAPWVTPERMSRLHIADMAGRGPLWGPRASGSGHTDSVGDTTAVGHKLRQCCEVEGAKLLIVDPLAAAYGNNENNRALVRAFISDFDAWARDKDCAVLILAHPSKAGADYSGSTDWEASVRSLWTLRKEKVGAVPIGAVPKGKGRPNLGSQGWQLGRPKANYGPPVNPVQLDWDTCGTGLRWRVTGEWSDAVTQQTTTATNGSGSLGSI